MSKIIDLNIRFTSEDSKLVYENGNLLKYATSGSSGFDLRAVSVIDKIENDLKNEHFSLKPLSRCLVKTGIIMEIQVGYEIQIRPRSGLALKNGITVLNTPGTIDSDYRGEIGVILFNSSNEEFIIKRSDRIAQAILSDVVVANFNFTETLSDTERSSNGFGSSGNF